MVVAKITTTTDKESEMKNGRILFLCYPVVVGIIIKLPIGLSFRIALMFVACSVFVLLGVKGEM